MPPVSRVAANFISLFLVLIACSTVLFSAQKKNGAGNLSKWPVTVGHVDPKNHPNDEFSWYYVEEASYEKPDFEEHIVCYVDSKEVKWMRLNGKDVPLKLVKTTQNRNTEEQGSTFFELYTAGPYRVRMDCRVTYNPKGEYMAQTYDVTISVIREDKKVTIASKCVISE